MVCILLIALRHHRALSESTDLSYTTFCITSKRVMSRRGLSQGHCASGNSTPFEEMLQWWRVIGNTVSTRPARDLNLRPPAPETNASQLDQLAGYCNVIRYLRIQ